MSDQRSCLEGFYSTWYSSSMHSQGRSQQRSLKAFIEDCNAIISTHGQNILWQMSEAKAMGQGNVYTGQKATATTRCGSSIAVHLMSYSCARCQTIVSTSQEDILSSSYRSLSPHQRSGSFSQQNRSTTPLSQHNARVGRMTRQDDP